MIDARAALTDEVMALAGKPKHELKVLEVEEVILVEPAALQDPLALQ
jgi:hypothetical protein